MARVRQRLDVLRAEGDATERRGRRGSRAELDAAEAVELPLASSFAEAEAAARGRHRCGPCRAEDARRTADADRHTWVARAEALALALDDARARAGTERLAGRRRRARHPARSGRGRRRLGGGVRGRRRRGAGRGRGRRRRGRTASARAPASWRRRRRGAAAGRRRRAGTAAARQRRAAALARARRNDPRSTACSTRSSARSSWSTVAGTVAVDVALAHPDAVIVTRDGDRFGVTGWRVGGPASGATGAALEEARERAATARGSSHRRGGCACRGTGRGSLTRGGRSTKPVERSTTTTTRRLPADRCAGSGSRPSGATGRPRSIRSPRTSPTLVAPHRHRAGAGGRARSGAARARGRGGRRARAGPVDGGRAQPARGARAARSARCAPTSRCAPPALDERRQFLRRRSTEVEERLRRNVAEREAAASRRVELDRMLLGGRSPRRARRRAASAVVDARARRPARARGAARPRRPARSRRDSTACASSGPATSVRSRRCASTLAGPRSTKPRSRCGSRPRSRPCAATSTPSPTRAIAAECPPLPEGVTPAGTGARARARAAAHGADQPARARGVRGAAGAPRRSSRRSSTT